MVKNAVPHYPQFVDEFGTVYTRWLLRDLTPDNISRKSISFGPDFELRNGQFIYSEGMKKKTEVPIQLGSIRELSTNNDRTALYLMGEGNNRLAAIWIPNALNLEALYHILQMINMHNAAQEVQ
ncbi:MAG: hypothetical protein FWG10_10155 [Eubacteriaceae bacterium]|nr:hypothetical protein [Eubacteriaceae bacterium]